MAAEKAANAGRHYWQLAKARNDFSLFKPYLANMVEIRRQYGFHIVIDGGVTWDVLRRLWGYGVEGFVLGKQILFGQDEPYDKIIQKVRSI